MVNREPASMTRGPRAGHAEPARERECTIRTCGESAVMIHEQTPSCESSLDIGRRQLLRGAVAAAALPAWPALAGPKVLQVGGLPVTCNLTLPVACTAR